MNYMHQYDIPLGNIEPCTIFYEKKYLMYDMQLILGKYGSLSLIEAGKLKRFPYISPETSLVFSNNHYDLRELERHQKKSDIYQLGLTLLEM